MSVFDEIYRGSVVPTLMQLNAERQVSVDYVDASGTITGVVAIIQDEQTEDIDGPFGLERRRFSSIVIGRDEASATHKGVASPRITGKVVIAGETWAISGIAAQSDSMTTLDIERTQTIEKTRRPYRNL